MRYSSREHSRLYGFDPEKGLPSSKKSSSGCTQKIEVESLKIAERAACTGKDFEALFRIVVPQGMTRYVHGLAILFSARPTSPVNFVGYLNGRHRTQAGRGAA